MTVSVENLRKAADFMKQASGVDPVWLREAADEIELLQQRLEFAEFEWDRATSALKAASDTWPAGCHDPDSCARHKDCMYTKCRHDSKSITAAMSRAVSNGERR